MDKISFRDFLFRFASEGQRRYELTTAAMKFGLVRALEVREACEISSSQQVAELMDRGDWKTIKEWSNAQRKKVSGLK